MTPAQHLQQFLDDNKYVITVKPEFVQTNHGTYEIAVRNMDVNKLPEQELQPEPEELVKETTE